jgi:N-acetylmuramoyl-L-alanine amidase
MGWVCSVVFLQAVGLTAAASPARSVPVASAQITPELRASLSPDYELDVVVRPHEGDAWTRLAKRVTGDAEQWQAIAQANGSGGEKLTVEQFVRVPFSLLRPELQRQIVKTLFPEDRIAEDGWQHVVVGASGIEGESLWKIAEWFTGDGARYADIRRSNPEQGLSTRKGDVILVPRQLLALAFRAESAIRADPAHGGIVPRSGATMEGAYAPKTAAEVRKPEDDPVEHPSTNENAPEAAVEAVAVGQQPSLTYDRKASEPYAVYRLQKGEALYSSVAIRFTGRVYSKDVGDVLDRIVRFNGIEDVARIPVGYPVKIPLELLLPDYLPADDPTRLAQETSKRESAKLATHTRARNLTGVQVILDAGHGGRDVGTAHEGVFESTYVYDVMCRLKQLIEKKSAARVYTTTKSKGEGYDVPDRDDVDAKNDHVVLTTPKYALEDAVVGVHLRWYLANSIFGRAIRAGAAREKVVFLSIHADSLHPSLRGTMLYIPGEKYVQGSYEKRDKIYLTRAEVRERPIVTHSEKESLVAEGLSRDLAESIVDSLRNEGLKVHPFNPIRDNVVRDDREWVPAIIRYNLVPTRLLLEVCNLGNEKDRALMKTKRYRQRVAEAIYAGIVDYYADGEGDAQPAPPRLARAAK